MSSSTKQVERVSHDIASEAATHLGRCPTERGTDRLALAIAGGVAPTEGDAALRYLVEQGRLIVPKDSVFAGREIRQHPGKGLEARWVLRAFPMNLHGVEGYGATPDEALAAFVKAHKLANLRKQIEDRAKRELDDLAAIDQGTKHEQTRAEFLEDFNKKAEMEIHPFTPNPSKLAMDPALRELVAMDHDDTIERFSEEPDDTDE